MNAAINIGDRGLHYLQKQFGQTPETIRLARLEGLDPGSGERFQQEPRTRVHRSAVQDEGKKDGAQAPVRRASQPEAKTLKLRTARSPE